MAEGEEFAELAEINFNQHHHHHHHQYGGHTRWGGGGGGGGGPGAGLAAAGRPYPRHQAPPTATSYEAEDAMCSGRQPAGQGHAGAGGRTSYYSPPGTSYTIVERPASAPRGTYLGGHGGGPSSGSGSGPRSGLHSPPTTRGHLGNKKRPLSPEEVGGRWPVGSV